MQQDASQNRHAHQISYWETWMQVGISPHLVFGYLNASQNISKSRVLRFACNLEYLRISRLEFWIQISEHEIWIYRKKRNLKISCSEIWSSIAKSPNTRFGDLIVHRPISKSRVLRFDVYFHVSCHDNKHPNLRTRDLDIWCLLSW